MEERNYLILLYDFYEGLFNDKEKLYFEDYYFNNYSLSELSENYLISRNAIHKHIKSIEKKLLFYEENLRLYEKHLKLEEIILKIKDPQIKEQLKDL